MTVTTFNEALRERVTNTERGWERHSLRRVWLVARVEDDLGWTYLMADRRTRSYDLDDDVLACDSGCEARALARELKAMPVNLYDLFTWLDDWVKPARPRYRTSLAFLVKARERMMRHAAEGQR